MSLPGFARRPHPCRALSILLVMAVATAATAAQPKPKRGTDISSKDSKDSKPPAGPIQPTAPLFSLGGQAGFPAYLKGDAHTLFGLEGVVAGEVRTVATDFNGKDFVFDVLLNFDDQNRTELVAGIGENARDSNWIINSVALRLNGPSRGGYCDLTTGRHETKNIARLTDSGEYLLRIEKAGDALTFTLALAAGDKNYTPVASRTIPDGAKKANFLTDRNSALFFAGDALVKAVALSVNGKAVDPGKPAVDEKAAAARSAEIDAVPMVNLRGAAGLPAWLRADSKVMADADGLGGGETRTVAHDLIEHDFVFDLQFKFKGEDDHSICVVGIGENGREGGWILNSLCSRVHGPGHKGMCTLNFSKGREEGHLGSFGLDAGPHVLRIEKRGDTLTMAVCVDYSADGKGKFVPTFAKTIPDVKRAAPFLTAVNSRLFFDGGTGIFQAVRLVVDGKPVGAGETAQRVAGGTPANGNTAGSNATGGTVAVAGGKANESADAIDKLPLISLGGAAGLPPWLKADAKTLAGSEGVREGELRSVEHDLIDKDFTFDLLYQFDEGAAKIFLVGLGENGQDGGRIANSVCCRVHGPGHDGQVMFNLTGVPFDDPVIGKTLKDPGPHLIRLQKRGNTLTAALCVDYKADGTGDGKESGARKFEPTFSLTVPDLKSAAPFLKSTNSGLFLAAGDGGVTFKAVRLTIEGKAPPAPQAVAGAAGSTTPPATAIPAVAGAAGAENFIRLAGPGLPLFFQPQRDLKFEDGALVLDGKTVRTVAGDFLDKDFTFDVICHFLPDDHSILLVGLGENAREANWIMNSACARVHGPGHDGLVAIHVTNHEWNDPALGKTLKSTGPHLLRIQKRGNALTFALCPDYAGTFTPAFTRTIPDLKSAAPYLTSRNSFLFLGDTGRVDQVRLVVEGEPTETRDVELNLPAWVVEGQPLRRPLVKGAGAAMKVAVEAGPAGARVGPGGEIDWTPTREQLGTQTMRVLVSRGGQAVMMPAEVEVVSAADARAVGGDLAKIDSLYRVPLAGVAETQTGDKPAARLAQQRAGQPQPQPQPAAAYELSPGADGNSLLLLEGDTLRRLGPDGVSVRETIHLPAKYTMVRERPDYFVALSDEKQSLDVVDKKTLRVKRSVKMEYRLRTDLAIHPTKPTSYVCVEKQEEGGAVYSILIVDETSGEVLEPADFVGRWVRVAPGGRLLYAGYKGSYERRQRLVVNPDRVHVVPEYGSFDALIVYDIGEESPRRLRDKEGPGANGNGIVLSADGKRLAYLSYTGYPLYSGNVPAFDPTNFDKRPVSYPTKANGGGAQDVAFHPTLPIAAAPCEAGAVCFDRESGDVLGDLPDLKYPALGDVKARRVYFSPDGKNLLLECEAVGGEHYLRRVRLKLTAEQAAQLQRGESAGNETGGDSHGDRPGRRLPPPGFPRGSGSGG